MDQPISIKIYEFQKRSFVSAADLFDIIFPYTNQHYSRWVHVNITHQPQEFPIKGKDYVSFEEAKFKKPERIKGGKRRIDYLVSIVFAMQLCYQAKTLPARDLNNILRKFDSL